MKNSSNWLRLIGIVLLAFLLWRLDFRNILSILRQVTPFLVAVAIILNLPQIYLKVLRWRWLLRSQAIDYGAVPATLSYFGSIFIGLLTPGRLGEFVKAVHVSQDCNVSVPKAFSSVLTDRLFDLYALFVFGASALLLQRAGRQPRELLEIAITGVALFFPLAVFINERSFQRIQETGMRLGKWGKKLFGEEAWLAQLHRGIKQLSPAAVIGGVVLTCLAYGLFFGQCYLLAAALNMHANFLQVTGAVSLGSLVTLLPVSISGLGTREATIVAYLRTAGISAGVSLGFSLLLFATFYVAGGIMGAVAWYAKPVSWKGR